MSRVSKGTISLTLGDEDITLAVTIKAVSQINARFGGIVPAIQAVSAANFDAVCQIVQMGANITRDDARKALAEQVLDAGLTRVSTTVVDYLGLILGGGTDQPEDDGEDDGGDAGNG